MLIDFKHIVIVDYKVDESSPNTTAVSPWPSDRQLVSLAPIADTSIVAFNYFAAYHFAAYSNKTLKRFKFMNVKS